MFGAVVIPRICLKVLIAERTHNVNERSQDTHTISSNVRNVIHNTPRWLCVEEGSTPSTALTSKQNNMKALFFILWLMSPQQIDVETRFLELQDEGLVVYQEQGEFDEPLFILHTDDKTYEYCHKEEIIEFIKTNSFQYNDFLN